MCVAGRGGNDCSRQMSGRRVSSRLDVNSTRRRCRVAPSHTSLRICRSPTTHLRRPLRGREEVRDHPHRRCPVPTPPGAAHFIHRRLGPRDPTRRESKPAHLTAAPTAAQAARRHDQRNAGAAAAGWGWSARAAALSHQTEPSAVDGPRA